MSKEPVYYDASEHLTPEKYQAPAKLLDDFLATPPVEEQFGAEIEITPAMIEAGIAVLYREWGYNIPSGESDLVSAIFRAMSSQMATRMALGRAGEAKPG